MNFLRSSRLGKFQLIGIPRVGATLAVALKNRGFAPATKGDRKDRPYACVSNSPINSNLFGFFGEKWVAFSFLVCYDVCGEDWDLARFFTPIHC